MILTVLRDNNIHNTTDKNNSLAVINIEQLHVNVVTEAVRELISCIRSCFTPQGRKGTVG